MKRRVTLLIGLIVIIFFICQTTATDISTDGLVAYSSFDDGSANDNSGNGFDGTIDVDSAVPVEGFYGMGLQFDGYDDGLRLPHIVLLNGRIL